MSYTFHGLIGQNKTMVVISERLGLHAFALTESLAVIPFEARYVVDLGPSATEQEPDGMERCHSSIFANLIDSEGLNAFVYAEADFWAGEGEQAAMVIEDGAVVWKRNRGVPQGYPVEDTDEARTHISEALRRIGVETGEHRDAFDAVGLGRYRRLSGWQQQPQVRG